MSSDVLGVVRTVNDLSTITTRQTNKELKKRDVELVDKSQGLVRMTLWGQEAENFNATNNPVVAAKGVRVSDFGGESHDSVLLQVLIENGFRAQSVLRWLVATGCESRHP